MKKKYNMQSLLSNMRVINGMWLYTLQFFQLVVPLLTFPYLTRVLGAEKYGVFSIAINLITYLQVLEEYGFSYSGTRKLALAPKEKYSEVYSNILSAKLLLTVVSGIVLSFVLSITNYTPEIKVCMLILFGVVIGTALQQTWVFQGLQVMKYITITNVISRTISVICIFLFVKNQKDIFLYCFLYIGTNLLSGIVSVYFCKKKFGLVFKLAKLKNIFLELKDGFSLFLTSVMARVVSMLGVLLLGIYATSYDVGIYSAMQKIPNVIIMCFSPISQVLYPYISTLFECNKTRVKKIMFIMYGPVMTGIALMCIILCLSSEMLIFLLCGQEYLNGQQYVYILLIWVFFSIYNNFLGTQTLVASGRSSAYSKIFMISTICSILLNFILIKIFYCIGAAYATLISEIILTINLSTYIIKNRKQIFG